MQELAISLNPVTVSNADKSLQTFDLLLQAVKIEPFIIRDIKIDLSEGEWFQIYLAAVTNNVSMIYAIDPLNVGPNNIKDLYLEIAKRDSRIILFVKDHDVVMEALRTNPCSINFLDDPTDEQCKYAMSLYPDIIEYIKQS